MKTKTPDQFKAQYQTGLAITQKLNDAPIFPVEEEMYVYISDNYFCGTITLPQSSHHSQMPMELTIGSTHYIKKENQHEF
ncbi:MAG: hypothetical protein GY861_11350 [bacterium]|nr:hypothetical protein [bacterium]